jgi:5-methyltetrahydropteroyltriglutamate--homocysteine methyltransferase
MHDVTPLYGRHIGSIPKPVEVVELLYDQAEGKPVDKERLTGQILQGMIKAIDMQNSTGMSFVVSGEMDRLSFFHHVLPTITGYYELGREPPYEASGPWFPGDLAEFGQFTQATYNPAWMHIPRPACIAPIAVRDPDAVYRELSLYKQALAACQVPLERAIWTEPAPGVIAASLENHFPGYTERQYLFALVPVIRHRVLAALAEGIGHVQLDFPDLLMDGHVAYKDRTLEQFLAIAAEHVEALNETLDGIPLDRLYGHSCWGNYLGPDTADVPLRDVLPIIANVRVGTLCLESSNHVHELDYLAIGRHLNSLPPSLSFCFGVIDTKNPSVEAAEVVANRLLNMRKALGERVAGATPDCGFETNSLKPLSQYASTTPVPFMTWDIVEAKTKRLGQAVSIANESLATSAGSR